MGTRLATLIVLGLLVTGCGVSHPATHPATRTTGPGSVAASPSPPSTATPPAASPIPASFPLTAGWGAGDGDGRPHAVRRPLVLDVHDVRPFAVTGAVARRTMVFDQPEWLRAREVDVFPTAGAAAALVRRVVRHSRADTRGTAEDGSAYRRSVRTRPGGVVVATWAEQDGVPRVGTSTLVLHRSGRALLVSTDSAEGLGRRAALHEAAVDLRGLRPALHALTALGRGRAGSVAGTP